MTDDAPRRAWDPEVPPEEDGLDLLGRSLNAEQVRHEEELARLAVLEREALAAAAVSPTRIPVRRYDEAAVPSPGAENTTRHPEHRIHIAVTHTRVLEPARGAAAQTQRRASGSAASARQTVPAAAAQKRFIPSVTAAEEDRIIRENAGIAHRLESIQASKPAFRPRAESAAFDREQARDRVRRLKEKELERENWSIYKRLEGVRPTIKIGPVPTAPKRAQSAAERQQQPQIRGPRREWQD